MKEFLIMRHAKSSWADEHASDHQRTLNQRGRRDAPVMAQLLEREGLIPDQLLSSTATRALETAQLVCEQWSDSVELQELDELYLAPASTYLTFAARLPSAVDRVMFVGHNPGIESLTSVLCGQYERMPTAAIGCWEFDIDHWEEISQRSIEDLASTTRGVWRPKEI